MVDVISKYSLIYADPPWSFKSVRAGGSMKSGAAAQYPVMTIDQLKALNVSEIAADNCLLVMWYVGSQPQEALDLVEAWGFKLKHMNGLVWEKLTKAGKPFFGMGYYTRAGMESAIIAIKGRPKVASHSVRQVRRAQVGKHSQKPTEFRDDLVELCGDVPRIELFAREKAIGWDVFGNQVGGSIIIKSKEDSVENP